MTLLFAESGTDATQAFESWDYAIGACSTSTAQARTGPRSILCDSTGSNSNAYVGRLGVLAGSASRRTSFAFRVTSALPTVDPVIHCALDAAFAQVWYLCLRSTGVLALTPELTIFKNAATVLSTNTWYNIAVAYTLTAT